MENTEILQDELKVPFGIDVNGKETYPEDADRNTQYHCPDCKEWLVLRKGARKRTHFAHKVVPSYCDFLHNETELHLRAKGKVAQAINEGQNIKLIRRCPVCGKKQEQKLPVKDYHSSLEKRLPSGHRADVVILDRDKQLIAVIEIFETHEVDNEKKESLREFAWGEFYAKDIIESDIWEVRYDNFKTFTCKRCKDIEKYGKEYSFVGTHFDSIECPLKRQKIDVIDTCTSCNYFADATESGIICFGSKVNEAC